jgi:hypothetical protein
MDLIGEIKHSLLRRLALGGKASIRSMSDLPRAWGKNA